MQLQSLVKTVRALLADPRRMRHGNDKQRKKWWVLCFCIVRSWTSWTIACHWYGRKIIKIDRFYPSTQLCSGCGYKNESIKGLRGLKVREWICPECGEVHDRDLNASRNILKEGLKSVEPKERGDSKFTAHPTNRVSGSGDVLALEAHPL